MLKSLFSKPYSRLYIVGDNADWAIDEESKALEKTASSLSLLPARIRRAWVNTPQIVHYSSQFSVLDERIYKSRHKISIDYFHGKPEDGESYRRCFAALKSRPEISRIRVSNSIMEKVLIEAGVNADKIRRIPIGVDLSIFPPTSDEGRRLSRQKLGIREETIVIGSFQKDGVGWEEGNEPKPIKGPDIFIKTIEKLSKEIPNLFVLLSGPSRGYMKSELERLGIPYKHEFLKHYSDISRFYDALDLYLITSREEGGPKACLEAMAKGVPLVTTAVGQCVDMVESGENALMAPIDDATQLALDCSSILKDKMLRNKLAKNGFETARKHSLDAQIPLWKSYFAELIPQRNTIAIFHEFHKPPYGGGNQFLLALEKEFKKSGQSITRNEIDSNTKVVLFNSFNFDFDKLKKLKKKFSPLMIHRVDGPISVYRGENVEIDQKIWAMNHSLADKTIFQSEYSLQKHVELGLSFKEPIVIPNASDPELFHNHGRVRPSDGYRKIKLIASSWSDNTKKGGPTLTWLDKHLDTDKYELTFVGRTQAKFINAKTIEPLPSKELADLLREHDIYIAPSEDDPCSNALIEALNCGLPSVYRNSGGHPELVKLGGEPFTNTADLLSAIHKVAKDLSGYEKRINVLSLTEVAQRYLVVFSKET